MRPEEGDRIKARLADLMRTISWDVRQARLAIERGGETEAAIEALRHSEKELDAYELEFERDRGGRRPRIHGED